MRAEPIAGPIPFGALVRRHRVAAGLSQEALAERAGLSRVGSLTSSAARADSRTVTPCDGWLKHSVWQKPRRGHCWLLGFGHAAH